MDLLEETGKLGANPVDTAIEQNHGLHSHSGEPLHDKRANQQLVGKLIYVTITRPDISYAMSLVSQFMHAPRTEHLSAVHRILKYLKLEAKPVDTQIEQNHGLHSHNREHLHDKSTYQRLVGKLIYLTIIRPDISYAVSLVSQFMHAPRIDYLLQFTKFLNI